LLFDKKNGTLRKLGHQQTMRTLVTKFPVLLLRLELVGAVAACKKHLQQKKIEALV
jgi:hypothetical protein